MSKQGEKRTIEWRLNVVMSERRIKAVSELRRRLAAIGVSISSAQLGRVVWERPQKLNVELLEGLLTVLECDVADIIRVVTAPAPENAPKPTPPPKGEERPEKSAKEPKPRVRHIVPSTPADITGPRVTPLPLPERKR
jgi:DNA-binding Xre family transcriptional regulator